MPYVHEKDREAFEAFQVKTGGPPLDQGIYAHESDWSEFLRHRLDQSESVYCAVCKCHNGHSLSCATLNVDKTVIDGSYERIESHIHTKEIAHHEAMQGDEGWVSDDLYTDGL